MSEELEVTPEVDEPTPAQQKALDGGWTDLDSWHGDPEEWVDYKEFNFRGELMGALSEKSSIIANQKRQIDENTKVITDLAELQRRTAEREYKKALKDLTAQKAEAVTEGDGERVVELDEAIDGLKTEAEEAIAEPKATPTTPSQQPEIATWLSQPENQWYNQDPFLKSVAEGIAKTIMQNNPQTPVQSMLDQMTAKMKLELPHKFKSNVNSVDSGDGDITGATTRKGKKPKFGDLTQEQQDVARLFVKQGVMTQEEYIEDLVALGDI